MMRKAGDRRISIRARLTRQFVAAVLAIVVTFAAVTLVAITMHLYRDAEVDARMILGNLTAQRRESTEVILDAYSRTTDPRIWILQGNRVINSSLNAPPAPPQLSYTGLLWQPATYQLSRTVAQTTFVIDWPLSSDAALLRELSLVVLLVTLAGMGAGVAAARWTTHRALAPVKSLTLGVRRMLDAGRIMQVPMPSGRDEFYDLAGLLNRLLSDLEERRQRERTLLADATHHLRTPMAVIRGNLDLVQAGEDINPAVRDESLVVIDRTLVDMSRLVDDLLTMEHARNLPTRLVVPLDLRALMREVVEDARAIANEGTTVTMDQAPGGPAWGWAYPEFARRALWAIMENALKYCDSDHGQIAMAVKHDLDSGYVGILVSNNGKGIAAHEMPLIFSRFYRGEAARVTEGGTGLGLSLARSLMLAQSGTISMTSSDGTTEATLWFRQVSASQSEPSSFKINQKAT